MDCEGKQQSQISKVLEEASNAVANLEKSIEELNNRLTPISIDIPVCNKEQEKTIERQRCAVDSCIKSIIERINKQSVIVYRMREGLQV